MYDASKESNYLKIKNMDSYEYSVTEITNGDLKIKTINHKPSSIADLTTIFKQHTQVVTYVMLYYHKMPNGDFITLRPVKFYIGNDITMEQVDFINNKNRYIDVPKSDYYDFNQNARPVLLDDLINSLKIDDNSAENQSNRLVLLN